MRAVLTQQPSPREICRLEAGLGERQGRRMRGLSREAIFVTLYLRGSPFRTTYKLQKRYEAWLPLIVGGSL